MRKLDHISSHGHPKKDLSNVLCHRSEEGSAGATFLIRLAPHSYRVESGIYKGADPPPSCPRPLLTAPAPLLGDCYARFLPTVQSGYEIN